MLEKLKQLMKNVNPDVNLDNVTLDTKLIEDLHFDSLGMMMFAMAIEDEFGISFDEPMNFVTVKDVVDFIESHLPRLSRSRTGQDRRLHELALDQKRCPCIRTGRAGFRPGTPARHHRNRTRRQLTRRSS